MADSHAAIGRRLSEFCAVLRTEPERFRRWVSGPVLVLNLPIKRRLRRMDQSTATFEVHAPATASRGGIRGPQTTRVVLPLRPKPRSEHGRFFHVGRGSGCDLTLGYDSVSRLHAMIEQHADGTFSLRDAQSKNGTYLNGERIPANQPMELGEEAHIIFGEVEADFLLPDVFRLELDALASRRRAAR